MPLEYEEIITKFLSQAENIISSEKSQSLIDQMKNFENIKDVRVLENLIH
jgi:hypothetical protein